MIKNYFQKVQEEATRRFLKNLEQSRKNESFINYFKAVVGTAKYRTHKFR